MKPKMNRSQLIWATACLLVGLAVTAQSAQAQNSTKNPSPALVGQLTKQLSVTPRQATGGAGALFGLAKSRLSAADFSKVSAAVPGMNGLLRAAPSIAPSTAAAIPGTSAIPGLSGVAGSLPTGVGGLASVAESFQKLGLSPTMVGKFVPVLTQFVQARGGASTASLLGGALK